eukprot:Polyplicarium_translucidae@DN3548_c0_g1_i1.p1
MEIPDCLPMRALLCMCKAAQLPGYSLLLPHERRFVAKSRGGRPAHSGILTDHFEHLHFATAEDADAARHQQSIFRDRHSDCSDSSDSSLSDSWMLMVDERHDPDDDAFHVLADFARIEEHIPEAAHIAALAAPSGPISRLPPKIAATKGGGGSAQNETLPLMVGFPAGGEAMGAFIEDESSGKRGLPFRARAPPSFGAAGGGMPSSENVNLGTGGFHEDRLQPQLLWLLEAETACRLGLPGIARRSLDKMHKHLRFCDSFGGACLDGERKSHCIIPLTHCIIPLTHCIIPLTHC